MFMNIQLLAPQSRVCFDGGGEGERRQEEVNPADEQLVLPAEVCHYNTCIIILYTCMY